MPNVSIVCADTHEMFDHIRIYIDAVGVKPSVRRYLASTSSGLNTIGFYRDR